MFNYAKQFHEKEENLVYHVRPSVLQKQQNENIRLNVPAPS